MIRMKILALTVTIAGMFTAAKAATYNSDLLIGFTAQIGNDREYDMGPGATLTNGQSWNLSSILTNLDLSTVKWGVIGDTATAPHSVYVTKLSAGAPQTLANNAAWSAIDTPTKAIYTLFPPLVPGKASPRAPRW